MQSIHIPPQTQATLYSQTASNTQDLIFLPQPTKKHHPTYNPEKEKGKKKSHLFSHPVVLDLELLASALRGVCSSRHKIMGLFELVILRLTDL